MPGTMAILYMWIFKCMMVISLTPKLFRSQLYSGTQGDRTWLPAAAGRAMKAAVHCPAYGSRG